MANPVSGNSLSHSVVFNTAQDPNRDQNADKKGDSKNVKINLTPEEVKNLISMSFPKRKLDLS